MRQRSRLYHVTVKTPDGKILTVDVQAETFQLACRSAEAEFTAAVAVHYTVESEIAGRCSKCGCFIEIHERYQCRGDVLKCPECK